ncbi:MAG: hypothetical protein K2Q20_07230, partial [Phycisphaerales bacterium]|nr:hypothetical protein [Phycisphaerales bacterium]
EQQSAKRVEAARNFNRFTQTLPPAGAATAGSGPAAGKPAVEVDRSKFPGGIVPSKLPPRLMYGKVRTRGAHKQAVAQNLKPESGTGTPPPAAAGSENTDS